MRKLVFVAVALVMFAALVLYSGVVMAVEPAVPKHNYDISINGGTVIDPISGFQGPANIGIKDGIIVAIVAPAQRLAGTREIDATGLIIAPGFINIHGHATGTGVSAEVHVRDGITTTISGNCGFSVDDVVSFSEFATLREREGLIINVATLIGQNSLREAVGVKGSRARATPEQLQKMISILRQDMEDGALGISLSPYYAPGSTHEEMLATAKVAAEYGGFASSHLAEAFTVRGAVDSVNDGIQIAREAKIPFILSHIASCPAYVPKSPGPVLEAFYSGRAEGLKLAMDNFPYDAVPVGIGYALFDYPVELLLSVMESNISDFESPHTVVIDGKVFMNVGESYSSIEQFKYVHQKVKSKEIPDPSILVHFYSPPSKFDIWMNNPLVMIENDGDSYIDKATGKYAGSPMYAGAFAKFLGYYVREQGACDLRTALARTSTNAASFLGLEKKGRVQVGCDADLTIFDAAKIIDKSTFADPGQPSAGIPYVLVNGVLAVDGGEYTGATAGKIIKRTWKVPGDYPNLGKPPAISVGTLNP